MERVSKELIGASAGQLILSVLQLRDHYGYEILQTVKQLSDGKIQWHEGSIYPLLKKMEARGLVKSYWKVVQDERPRKYYSLLTAGQTELQNEKEEWNMVNSIFSKLWTPAI